MTPKGICTRNSDKNKIKQEYFIGFCKLKLSPGSGSGSGSGTLRSGCTAPEETFQRILCVTERLSELFLQLLQAACLDCVVGGEGVWLATYARRVARPKGKRQRLHAEINCRRFAFLKIFRVGLRFFFSYFFFVFCFPSLAGQVSDFN